MDPTQERFTDRAYRILDLASRLAQINGEEYISPEHILMGFAIEGDCEAMGFLHCRLGISPDFLQAKMQRYMTAFLEPNPSARSPRYIIKGPEISGKTRLEIRFDQGSLEIFEEAHREVSSKDEKYVATSNILLAMLRVSGSNENVKMILMKYGAKYSILEAEIKKMHKIR